MPQIDHITLPSGTVYEIADATARAQQAGAIILRGETTTALTNGATTNPIQINGESFTAHANDAVFYGQKEFVFDGTHWHEFGDMSGMGSLAMKDSASGSFTPGGTIAVNAAGGSGTAYTPTGSIAVNAASGSGTSYTPEGSVSAPAISVKTAGATKSITPFGSAGTLPELTMTVTDGNLTIGFSQGTLPTAGTAVTVKTGDAAYQAAQPTFTGTEKKLAFSGDQKKLQFTGTPGTVTVS